MTRVLKADFTKGFPTLPGVSAHAGEMLEFRLDAREHRLQVMKLDKGDEGPEAYVVLRDAVGRPAPDLVVRVAGARPRLTPQGSAEGVRFAPGSIPRELVVESKAFGVNARVSLRVPRRVTASRTRKTGREKSRAASKTPARARQATAQPKERTTKNTRKK